jgi:hypothetical protein
MLNFSYLGFAKVTDYDFRTAEQACEDLYDGRLVPAIVLRQPANQVLAVFEMPQHGWEVPENGLCSFFI